MNIFRALAKKFLNRPHPVRENEGGRIVVLHNHIFKNAGSTIDWALERNFGRAFVDHRADDLMRQGPGYLGPYLQANRQIQALSSHHLTMPLPQLADVRLMMIMMFRHPIERVTSVYNFERAQISDTHPGVIHARKLSLRDYILWRMRPEVGATIRDFHARKMLPPLRLGQNIINDDLDNLKKQLSGMELLGLLERFDESMVLFEDALSQVFPNIDLSYVAQNVGQDRSVMQEERLGKLRADIGDEVYELLVSNNHHDLKLLSFVECEFESRISAIDNFPDRLAEFRSRCAEKARGGA